MKLSSLMDSKHVHAKNSNGTSVGTFSKFNLLRGRCTLLLSMGGIEPLMEGRKSLEGG